MNNKKLLSVALASALVIPSGATSLAAVSEINSGSSNTHEKIIGKDRYETGVLTANKSGKTKNLILVNGKTEKMVDGLCASALVDKYDATVLPINPENLRNDARELINNAENIYIIGMYESISKEFEDSIPKNVKVERIGGKDRFATSLEIAKRLSVYDEAYLVNGYTGQPDAMSMSSVAAKYHRPILLVKGDSAPLSKDINVNYTVIGGEKAVSSDLQKKFEADRINGANRYETNKNVLNKFYPNSKMRYFTNGETLIDALSAASISKNDGITFVNENKNLDLLENINTIQIGGIYKNGNSIDIEFKDDEGYKPSQDSNTGSNNTNPDNIKDSSIKIEGLDEKNVLIPEEYKKTDVNSFEGLVKFNIENADPNLTYYCKVDGKEYEAKKSFNGSTYEVFIPIGEIGGSDKKPRDINMEVIAKDNNTVKSSDSVSFKIKNGITTSTTGQTVDFGKINDSYKPGGFSDSDNSDISRVEFKMISTEAYENAKNDGYNGSENDRIKIYKEGETLYIVSDTNISINGKTNSGFTFKNNKKLTSVGLNNCDTSAMLDMSYLFSGCSRLTELDLSQMNLNSVTNTTAMFSGCTNLKSITFDNWNLNNITTMNSMFLNCESLTEINTDSMIITDAKNLKSMAEMFQNCKSLTSLDLSTWNTSNVNTMANMFKGCNNLKTLNLSGKFNTSKVTSFSEMFAECTELTELNLQNFNTSKGSNFISMFNGCSSLTGLDLSNFNTAGISGQGGMNDMFLGCTAIPEKGIKVNKDKNVWKVSFIPKYNTDGDIINAGSLGLDDKYFDPVEVETNTP